MKYIYIFRGVSGCGKSTFAESLVNLINYQYQVAVCCADDYFMQDGEYKFDQSKLGAAHGFCRNKFKNAVDDGCSLIVVANTNVKGSDWKFYQDYGEEKGYTVFFLVIEKRHFNNNEHQVPELTLRKQESRLRNSLKLL
jgi:predicted ABC-type ATPase